VVWLVIGEGPERPALEAHARAMGISDSVRFLGHRNDIPTIMASLDLLVHPTSGEGFGLVLLEAMTQATPIVATRVGALPEIVEDGVTGVLVPPRDAPALSASIERMLGDSAILRSMGDAGRQRFERLFTINRMVTETLEVYEKLLDGRCAS
jgi:glycosyltransferase involved in cell wall biosynthesis